MVLVENKEDGFDIILAHFDFILQAAKNEDDKLSKFLVGEISFI